MFVTYFGNFSEEAFCNHMLSSTTYLGFIQPKKDISDFHFDN